MKKIFFIILISLIGSSFASAQKLGYYRLNIDDIKLYTELLYGERAFFDNGERPLLQQFVTYVRANKDELPIKANTKVNVSALTSYKYVQAADGYYESFLKDGRLLKFQGKYGQYALDFINDKTAYKGAYYPTKKETKLYEKSYTVISFQIDRTHVYQPDKKYYYHKGSYPLENIVATFEEGTRLVYDTPKLKIYEHPSALHSNRINTLRYFVEKKPSSSYFMDAVNFIKENYPDYLQVQANEKL